MLIRACVVSTAEEVGASPQSALMPRRPIASHAQWLFMPRLKMFRIGKITKQVESCGLQAVRRRAPPAAAAVLVANMGPWALAAPRGGPREHVPVALRRV